MSTPTTGYKTPLEAIQMMAGSLEYAKNTLSDQQLALRNLQAITKFQQKRIDGLEAAKLASNRALSELANRVEALEHGRSFSA